MKMKYALLFSGVLLVLGAGAARGEAVSKEPPAAYRTRLAPLLTPLEQVLKDKDAFAGTEQAGVVLLSETVRSVDATGKGLIAIHRVIAVRTEAGVKPAGDDVESYRKTDQRIHLVLAHSIQPDGTRQPVAANGAFLQSPQREADASLYSDTGELVVIFPNVKPGTITESIIVIEDREPRIPNEYTGVVSLDNGWAIATQRHVLEMDEALAKRLRLTPLGAETPVPTKVTPRAGQVRYTWERRHVPRAFWEPERAPASQVGPTVWLTTWPDWNAFASWYRGLLKDRDQLPVALRKEVDAWTKPATNAAHVLSILLEKVARDVRYTGLEFGRAAFQPQAPATVWTNQYGDCKDKSNLLRALLAYKGVRSYLAFLDTDHAGRLEANSPDYRQFDHVILAVPQPAGGYVFCDPTIQFALPGLLRTDDVDREVVLVKEDSAEFVRTPAQSAGALRYDFDLKLRANGGLEGWLTIESTDYNAAHWAAYFLGQTRERVREQMLGVVRDFYKGAQLIDVEQSAGAFDGRFRIRAYWMVPGGTDEESRRDTIVFPRCDFLYPQFQTERLRRTLYWQTVADKQVQVRIQLPAGWAAESLPRPLQVETAPVALSARWENDGGKLVGTMTYRPRQNRVAPEQFALLDNATQSLAAWLAKPVTVKHGAATAAAKEVDLSDFPMMPTGEGQLELIQQRFPPGSDLRKEALGRVLQWFPNDKPARFMAQMRLLELELRVDPKNAAVLQHVRELTQSARRDIESNYHSWGEYQYAMWLVEAGKRDEGLAIYQRLARDTDLSPFRRGWAAVQAVELLKDKQPKEALALLRTTIDLESNALPAQYDHFARLLLSQKLANELRDRLQKLAANKPRLAAEALAQLLRTANELLGEGQREHAETLAGVIEKAIKAGADLSHLEKDLAAVRDSLQHYGLYQKIVADLRQHLATNAPPWWSETSVSAELKKREELEQAISRLEQQDDYRQLLRHRLELLLRFPPEPEEFPEQLWRLAATAGDDARNGGLRSVLLNGCDQLPRSSSWYFESRFTRAAVLLQAKDEAGAMKIYDAMLADPQLPPTLVSPAQRVKAELLEKRGDYDGALALYRKLEHDLARNPRSYNALLHATFINLARGQQAEAERLIKLMAKADEQTLREVLCRLQITDFVKLTKAGEAEAYWKRQAKWWPMWEKLEVKFELAPLGNELVIPVIPNLVEHGRELGYALQSRDKAAAAKNFRVMMNGARWQPRLAAEAAGVTYSLGRLFPHLLPELHELCVVMLGDLAVSDPEVAGSCHVQFVAHQADSGKWEASRESAAAGFKKYADSHVAGPALARLWGLTALQTKTQLEPAAAALEQILARADYLAGRINTVGTLADVYRALHRSADELALLKRELAHPALQDNGERDQLQARYDAVRADSASALKFNQAVADWLKAHKPAWYDYAEPHEFKDPRCRNLSDDDDNRQRRNKHEQLRAETVKAGLLVAQSPEEPYARRVEAFRLAMSALAGLLPDGIAVREHYAALYTNAQFDEQLRAYWLWFAFLQEVVHGGDLTPYTKHELASRYNDWQKKFQKRAEEFVPVLLDPKADLEAVLMRQLEKPLDNLEFGFFNDGFARLLARGQFEAAKRVYDAIGKASFDATVQGSRSQIQLQFLRQLNAARQLYPRHKAAADLVLARLRPTTAAPPAHWRYIEHDSLDRYDRRTAIAIQVAMLENNSAPHHNSRFWDYLLDALPRTEEHLRLRFEVAQQFIEKSTDDEVLASAAFTALEIVDTDDPTTREKLIAVLKPYRDNDKWPQTFGIIRLFEVSRAWRAGQSFDFESAFDNLKWARAAFFRNRFLVGYYLQKKDVAALKPKLLSLSADELVDPDDIERNLPALELCGLKDEAQLVREAGQKELYRAILRSWCSVERRDVGSALRLAECLNATNSLPAAWEQHILTQTKNEPALWGHQLQLARLRQDWSAVLAAADRILADCPAFYEIYWDKANALHRLNRSPEAIAPLKTFIQFCHDDRDHPTATALLNQLQRK